ncbi:MAG: hypothetical protein MR593_02005 [Intestinibacter sp.]|nr:hypothetical protein [Intestinibacter sp.]MCI6736883.1 hypothetical protein [Intestinibacter sp.]
MAATIGIIKLPALLYIIDAFSIELNLNILPNILAKIAEQFVSLIVY